MEAPATASEAQSKAAKEAWRRAQRTVHAANAIRRRRAVADDTIKPIPTTAYGWGLEAILADAQGLALFRKFCEANFASENLDFLLEAREWRTAWNTSEPAERAATAVRLVSTYLADGAPSQVSLPSTISKFPGCDPSGMLVHWLNSAIAGSSMRTRKATVVSYLNLHRCGSDSS